MPKKKSFYRKSKSDKNANTDEMWINPNSTFRSSRGDRAWENRPGGVSNSARFLELADLALGLKKPETKTKTVVSNVHPSETTEPYSTG